MRQIIFRLRFHIEAAMPHVADKTDDGDPFYIRLARVAKSDALAEDFLVWKPLFGEGVVDDHHARAVELVTVVEEAALQQRDLDDRKILRRDNANLFVRINLIHRRIAAFDVERAVTVRPAQRQNGGERCRFDSRKRFHAPNHFGMNRPPVRRYQGNVL